MVVSPPTSLGQAAQAHAHQPDGPNRIGLIDTMFNRGSVRARRRSVDRGRDRLGRVRGLHGHRDAVDADGGRSVRLRQVPLGEPDRCVRARVRSNYTDQTKLWVRARRCRGPTPKGAVEVRKHAHVHPSRTASQGHHAVCRLGEQLPRWCPLGSAGSRSSARAGVVERAQRPSVRSAAETAVRSPNRSSGPRKSTAATRCAVS